MKNEVVEQWRPVSYPEWSTLFEVSSEGRVRRRRDSVILAPRPEGPGGALRVALYDPISKRIKLARLARIVLDTFRGESSNGHVQYEDENPQNCRLENLSYPTPRAKPACDENGNLISTCPTIAEIAEQTFCGVAPLITDALRRHRDNPNPELLTEADRRAISARLASLIDAGAPELAQNEAA